MPKVRSTVDKWIKSHPDLKYANKTLSCLACVKTEISVTSLNKKILKVFSRNEGFQTVSKIGKILSGENVEVERSLSKYKNILSERRRNLLVENIEKFLIVSCFDDEETVYFLKNLL
ncbi:hypothetical protein ILUMI_00581 [Ignelater luminosus]|uniref:Uncharacterized protein n=1 Tax=Ignelater luminosus TaxID=2038154 RepID=A0A8K0DGZ4_IGNLU|nr:hypothetical protein ILUMI_00581 [Ignelater luminosus]